MSPQVAEFNREAWAELEALLRGYLYENPGVQLYVVTGPVLEPDLPVIERSVNKVSIPERYFKVALDLKNGRGIGFIMPNEKISYPLESFAVSIDQVEAVTGLDFFNKLPEAQENALEQILDKSAWIPELAGGDVEPLFPPDLPPNHFNTVQSRQYMGKGTEINVCGTVVSTRYSRSGNLWLNIDKRFPNQIFSVFIRKKDLPNFSFDPQIVLANNEHPPGGSHTDWGAGAIAYSKRSGKFSRSTRSKSSSVSGLLRKPEKLGRRSARSRSLLKTEVVSITMTTAFCASSGN